VIYGIGADIVRVSRIQRGLDRFGERFARRILTPQEWNEFARSKRPAHFLATHFAAKEAAAKAMGLGFRGGLSPRNIGVVHDAKGRPWLDYQGRAEELRVDLGIGESHVSLADEDDHALAFVTLLVADR
jgi:holo-[acyl-carrier protein] synthase